MSLDYDDLQGAVATVCTGDGPHRGLEGLAQAVDRLTLAVAVATAQHVVVGSPDHEMLTIVIEAARAHLGIDDPRVTAEGGRR